MRLVPPLLLLLLLLPGHWSLAAATTVSGTVNKPDGTPVNGTIEFVLSQQAKTTTPPVLYVPVRTSCAVTNGQIAAGCVVQGNDTLDPAGTFYRVRVLDNNQIEVMPFTNYTLTGTAVDLGSLPITAQATLVPPTGSVTGDLNVTGNLTVGGAITWGADPQIFGHVRYAGLTADPGNVANGSTWYRSDLDSRRLRVGRIELWDGSQFVDLRAQATNTLETTAALTTTNTSGIRTKRINFTRWVDPNLWTEATVTDKIDAAISDCAGLACLVVLPSNLGAGEPTSVPSNVSLLDLRTAGQARFSPAWLPRTTGDDLGSATLRWDGFFEAVTTGVWNNVRVVDGFKYARTRAGVQQAIDDAAAGDTVYLPRAAYTGTGTVTIPNTKDGFRLIGSGSALTTGGTDLEPNVSSGAGIKVEAERVVLAGFSLRQAGTARTQIGIDIGDATNPGHFIVLRELSVTNFDEGVRIQQTFYGGFRNVDSFANGTYNWHLTNVANSNDFFNVQGRGTSITDIGVRVDDTTSNSSTNRFHGGTFEGNTVIQADIVGADRTMFVGSHLEPGSASALTGTITLTNGSTAMSATGGAFTTELKAGRFVKLDADGNTFWMRVESITDDNNAVLSDQYQGTGGSGAASKNAGNARVVNGVGAAGSNYFINTKSGAATPGVYFQSGDDSRGEWGDAGLIVIGSGATRTVVNASGYSGGLVDLGQGSQVLGDPQNSRHYIKIAASTTKGLDTVVGSAATDFKRGDSGDIRFFTNATERLRANATSVRIANSKLELGANSGVSADGAGFKHARVSTGSIAASSSAGVTVTWTSAFADANYSVTCSVVEATASTASLRVHHLESVAAGSVVVRVANDDAGNPHTGTLHCVAVHD